MGNLEETPCPFGVSPRGKHKMCRFRLVTTKNAVFGHGNSMIFVNRHIITSWCFIFGQCHGSVMHSWRHFITPRATHRRPAPRGQHRLRVRPARPRPGSPATARVKSRWSSCHVPRSSASASKAWTVGRIRENTWTDWCGWWMKRFSLCST